MNREEVRQIIEQIAEGVWNTNSNSALGVALKSCHFCCVSATSSTNEHAEWCPVRMSREMLENSSYMY
jgi:hypothetical protein